MLWMIIERFEPGALERVGARFAEQGRLLPDGVEYVDSWMTPDGEACYQLMRAPSRADLDPWMDRWSDLVRFEVHRVEASKDYWATRRA